MRPHAGCTYVVCRPFAHGERAFDVGDVFPFAELGLPELHAVQMWAARYLEVKPAATVQPAQSGTIQTAAVQMPDVASAEIAQQLDRRERRFNKHRR